MGTSSSPGVVCVSLSCCLGSQHRRPYAGQVTRDCMLQTNTEHHLDHKNNSSPSSTRIHTQNITSYTASCTYLMRDTVYHVTAVKVLYHILRVCVCEQARETFFGNSSGVLFKWYRLPVCVNSESDLQEQIIFCHFTAVGVDCITTAGNRRIYI